MALTQTEKKASVTTLGEMIRLLGFAAEIVLKEEDDNFSLSLKSADPGRLIGRKGYYLHSLELILNRILRKKYTDFPWVEVDVDGYRRKRCTSVRRASEEDTERLTQMALDAAKEVKRWGQAKRIGPFNARDRRVIHVALREDEQVETESESGDERSQKKVVVRLVEKNRQ